MAADFVDDGVLNERGAGWGGTGYDKGDFLHLPPKERRKAVERKRSRQERWQRAEAVRENWTREQHEEEARRIAAEIEAWERQRDAA
ncbi:hypothetical protein BWR17_03970 [Phaeobacter inhibens]|uniref:hypothetical protein n=1 Tax=Phaeobacter inhibens TaxID=221822 RepID=UPI0009718576|nr:hypothetical protein [Phaeobacter inhibens]APX15087.1 hypothetical protein BWR17_03970 [Phaeobacter inhibens]